jgi:phosphatidylserine/phosphatidylglycerophosphate/cardiolipin synthase-like enzyme
VARGPAARPAPRARRHRPHPGGLEGLPRSPRACCLHLCGIRAAKTLIYLENQYLTSPIIVEALAERLAEPDGPEVVTVGPARSPSYFDQMTMDSARTSAINRLREVDVTSGSRPSAPIRPRARPIIVHSKVAIMDDWMLRVGSANLNNRSIGLDTECDLAIEGQGRSRASEVIRAFLGRLVGHFLDREAVDVLEAMEREGGLARRSTRWTSRAVRRAAAARAGPQADRRAAVHRRLEPGRRHRARRRLAALGPPRAPQAGSGSPPDRAAAGAAGSPAGP